MDGLEPPACPLLRGPLSRLSYISIWWSQWDSNPQPTACKAVALSSWSYDPRSQLIYVLMELPTTHNLFIVVVKRPTIVRTRKVFVSPGPLARLVRAKGLEPIPSRIGT